MRSGFVPGSHDGELFDQYEGDHWRGALAHGDLARGAGRDRGLPDRSRRHGDGPQLPNRPRLGVSTSRPGQRPLLLNTYTAADAFAYTPLAQRSAHGEELIRGRAARWARHDPRPCQVGPGVYRPIFAVQRDSVEPR